MRESLKRLLNGPLDYAGLYPPTQLDLPPALAEYQRWQESPDCWILGRFLCPAPRADELLGLLPEASDHGPDPIELSVTASAGDPSDTVARDMETIRLLEASGRATVSAYEIRLPDRNAIGALKPHMRAFDHAGIDVYVEFPWAEETHEAMHEAVALLETVGLKARTGGVKSEDFPSTEDLAQWIRDAASLESNFKFTAGLHEPLRHLDAELGVHRHGFLNVMLASALTVTHDLSVREIDALLRLEDAPLLQVADDHVAWGPHVLSMDDIDIWWMYFGGFGSCSVDEPLAGLRRLGLLEGAGA